MNTTTLFVAAMLLFPALPSSAFMLTTPNFVNNGQILQLGSISALHMSSSSTSNSTIGVVSTASNHSNKINLRASPMKTKMPDHEQHGPVTAAHSIEEFLDLIEDTEENELVIVKIHAKWCKVCARAILKYKKMALKYAGIDTPVPIKFISVEASANKKIIEELEIKKFPYLQIYRNRECVASFGTGPAHNFQRAVGGTVEQKLNTELSEWNAFRSEFKSEISSGLEMLERLRLHAVIEEECEISRIEDCVAP